MGVIADYILGRSAEAAVEETPKQNSRSTHNVSASRGTRSAVMAGKPAGPNSAVSPELRLSQDRARDAVRNGPYISNGLRSLVKHEIGTGITCTFENEDENLRDELNSLWKESIPTMFAEHVGHLYAAQRLISRGRNEVGEIFIRRRRRPAYKGMAVPMQCQLLESDMLDPTFNRTLNNGNQIISSIEMNTSGERIAYHFFKKHPSDRTFGTFTSEGTQRVRILAKDVIHHYIPLRAGQLRALPVFSSGIFKNSNLEAYDDYELERKKNKASFTGTIEREARYDPATGVQIDPLTGIPFDMGDEPLPSVSFQAGSITQLGDGENLNLFDGESGGEFYADYMRQQLMAISASFGVPYELVTGDWKSVNDRILRAILNDFQREIEAVQEIYLIQQVLEKIAEWWLDEAVFSGAISLPDYANKKKEYLATDWRPQGWAYVHPLQDAQAAVARIGADLSTHEKEARKLNCDSSKVLEANIAHATRKKQLMSENDLLVEEKEPAEEEEEK